MPLAQVNGSSGRRNTASMDSRPLAISFFNSMFSRDFYPDVWLTPGMKSFVLCEKQSCRIHALSIEDRISFLDLECGKLSVRSQGLEWEGDRFMGGLVPSLSNRVSDSNYRNSKPVEVTVESGRCLVCVPYESVFERI